MRKKLAVIAMTCTAIAGAGLVGASPASADDLCESVYTHGTIVGYHQLVGPTCVPSPTGGYLCENNTVGFDPTVLVTESICVPRP